MPLRMPEARGAVTPKTPRNSPTAAAAAPPLRANLVAAEVQKSDYDTHDSNLGMSG